MMSGNILGELLHITIGEVSALSVYLAYAKSSQSATFDLRGKRYLEFVKWAVEQPVFKWDYATLAIYESYLLTKNSASTASQKVSMVRQFLKCAEEKGIINKCVFYKKRGRKAKAETVQTQMVCLHTNSHAKSKNNKADESVKELTLIIPSRCKKTFLRDLFGLGDSFSKEDLKRSYKKLARLVHPDILGGNSSAFVACKDAFDYLYDDEIRDSYIQYMNGQKVRGYTGIDKFTHVIYNSMKSIYA